MKIKALIVFIAIISFMVVGCDNGSTSTPQKPQVTAKITVPAITAVANPMNFGAVSALSGFDANFAAADVTYTLTLSKGGSTVATVESTSATSIGAGGRADGDYTLTQTFKYKGVAISGGSRSAGIEIAGQTFVDMFVSETNYTTGSFSSLTLNLSKDSK